MSQELSANFFQSFSSLSPSDIIEIIGIIVSTSVSIIAIIISVKTLKQTQITNEQNNRMLEESTRPYIAIYLDTITICEQSSFFVLKNFGQSSAKITLFEFDPILKTLVTGQKEGDILLKEQYDTVKGLTLAPGQSKMMLCEVTEIPKDVLTFKIGYVSSEKYYEESFDLNVKNYCHIPVPRPKSHIPEGNERQVQSLREIIDRLV